MTKDEFLGQMRQRFQEAETAENENRVAALDDLKFVHNYDNAQWDSRDLATRRSEGRPVLSNNLLRKFMRSMIGAMKQTRPSIKVRPVDSNSDPFMAELRSDLFRQIEHDIESPAEQAYDKAYEGAISNAFGYIRIGTDYENNRGFEQKIQIKRVENPFTVYLDPGRSNFLGTDGRYAFVNVMMDKDEYKQKYPNAPISDEYSSVGESYEKWYMHDKVRVAEYFYRVPVVKQIAQLDDLSVVELTDKITKEMVEAAGRRVVRIRKVPSTRVMWTKVAGNEILEAPRPWAGRFIPIIPVFGDEVNIEGKRVLYSFFRDAKDPQRMYNFWLTAATEIVAMSPKVPYIGTSKQFEGHEKKWQEANRKNYAYLEYNPDKNAGGRPTREPSAQVPAGHITMLNISGNNIMDTLGRYQASLGQQSNERSGKALRIRQSASDQVTFSYLDNFHQSLLLTGYIAVDLMPAVYDTERIVRLRGIEDTQRFMSINTPYYDPESDSVKVMNDLSAGDYDVEFDIGPSYATKRQEAVDSMIELFQYVPQIGPLVADLVVKQMDFPGAQDVAARIKAASQQGAPQ